MPFPIPERRFMTLPTKHMGTPNLEQQGHANTLRIPRQIDLNQRGPETRPKEQEQQTSL